MRQIFFGAGQRRQVPDVIEAAGDVERSRDVAFDEAEVRVLLEMRQIAARAGDQIVQADDAVAFRQQAVAQMRTDETGGPRNQMFHLLDLNVCGNAHATFEKVPGFSPFEIIVFLVLLAASAGGFCGALRQSGAQDPRSQAGCGFQAGVRGQARLGFRFGSSAAEQSDPRAAAAGPRARFRVLGILRVRAGHAESFRHGCRPRVPGARQLGSAHSISISPGRSRLLSRSRSRGCSCGGFVVRPRWLGGRFPRNPASSRC